MSSLKLLGYLQKNVYLEWCTQKYVKFFQIPLQHSNVSLPHGQPWWGCKSKKQFCRDKDLVSRCLDCGHLMQTRFYVFFKFLIVLTNQHRCIIISRQSKSAVANTPGNFDILGIKFKKTSGGNLLKCFFQVLPVPVCNLELEKLKLGFYIKKI